jgi:hypothetical protein
MIGQIFLSLQCIRMFRRGSLRLVHLTRDAMNPQTLFVFCLQPGLVAFMIQYPLTRPRFPLRYDVRSRRPVPQPLSSTAELFLVILRCRILALLFWPCSNKYLFFASGSNSKGRPTCLSNLDLVSRASMCCYTSCLTSEFFFRIESVDSTKGCSTFCGGVRRCPGICK